MILGSIWVRYYTCHSTFKSLIWEFRPRTWPLVCNNYQRNFSPLIFFQNFQTPFQKTVNINHALTHQNTRSRCLALQKNLRTSVPHGIPTSSELPYQSRKFSLHSFTIIWAITTKTHSSIMQLRKPIWNDNVSPLV